MKPQAESSVHSPFTKRQPYQPASSTSSMLEVFLQDKGLPPSSAVASSSLPQQTSAPHVVPPPASALPKMAAVPSLGQQVSPSSSDAQSPLPLQQHKLKQQKKRTSITTKVTLHHLLCRLLKTLHLEKTSIAGFLHHYPPPSSCPLFTRYLPWLWRCRARRIFQALTFSLGRSSLGRSRFCQSTSPLPPPQLQQTRFRTVSIQAQAGWYTTTTLQPYFKTGTTRARRIS